MDQQLTLPRNAGKVLTGTLAAAAVKAFANSGIPDMVVSAIKETVNSRLNGMGKLTTRNKTSGSRTNRARRSRGSSSSSLNKTGRGNSYFSARENPNNHGLKRYSAPVTIGSSYPPTRFGFCGTADGMADHDNIGSLKIKGSCIFGPAAVSYYSAVANQFSHGVMGANSSQIDRAVIAFDIGSLDPRVQRIASVFEFFKFRRLRVTYCPLVGTNYGGNITLSIFDDYLAAVNNASLNTPAWSSANVLTQIAGCSQWTNTAPIWAPFCLDYIDRGSKLYPVYALAYSDDSADDEFPLALVAVSSGINFDGGPLTVNTGYNLGQIFLEYEVDLYEPSFPQTAIEAPPPRGPLSPIPEAYEIVEDQKSLSSSLSSPLPRRCFTNSRS